jgi:D-tagatose-1,6-bisphosphate aldolase subunit GatZ/KbaZ
MKKAEAMIRDYVEAGYSKIHIDTSMGLGDREAVNGVNIHAAAERAALLCGAAEEAYRELKPRQQGALPPVYVIGSEVPTPGGSPGACEPLKITLPSDFEETVCAFHKAFKKYAPEAAWDRVVAVVVQPGVEFGEHQVWDYDRAVAAGLCAALKKYPRLVFEGHSTDYQTPDNLKKMVEDGIAVLKVGPALTFALREALFMLNQIEIEVCKYYPEIEQSNFIQTLDSRMGTNPVYWSSHYQGDGGSVLLSRRYSFSDRCRYYLPDTAVGHAITALLANLKKTCIPLTLISQYMPAQYLKIRRGLLQNDPCALLKDKIREVLEAYCQATGV